MKNIPNELSKLVVPHNDYFAAEFVLAFPSAGMHLVRIDTAVQDEKGILWNTGPSATLNVRSYDEKAVLQQHLKDIAHKYNITRP